jgi:ribonuclease BN (tRNA processing enzyme)
VKVTLLGTGAAVPTDDRYQAGAVVESAAEAPLLIDCGAGTLHRLVQAGYDPAGIETLLVTHHHLDHVADLPSLLKVHLLAGDPGLTVVGPPGTQNYLEPLLAIDRLDERVDVRIRTCQFDGDAFRVNGHDVATCGTEHSVPGFAYRLDDAVTLSGDTEASDRIAAFAGGSAVLVHDCAYADESRSNHATPRALGRALADVDVWRVYLTHLYPGAAADAERLRETVQAAAGVDAHVADDLETIEIPTGKPA